MSQHALNLMAALVGLRNKNGDRIIFVTHSLGGLVCAQALLKAHKSVDEPDRAVEEATRRVAFLGTPFQGSEIVGWAEIGARLVSLLQDTNKALLADLKQSGHQLATISEHFPGWLREREGAMATNVEIVCFTEELETGKLGKIVTDESAHIKGYKVLSLHADHQGICKCSDRDDDKYQSLLDVLQRWMEGLEKAPEEAEQLREAASTPPFRVPTTED
ncbi:MAG: hypothetical protein L6R39_002237 [Caloplaca ligustica]|nr:MAG: hypothetical protein L6R39_002237 [Caloplaca ligustica]